MTSATNTSFVDIEQCVQVRVATSEWRMGGGELVGRAFDHPSVSAGLATSVSVEPREA